MVRKKVDARLRTLIENGVKNNHRSMLILVGDHGKDQVANLHYMLSKAEVKARPSVLWCYKKELGFSTHKQKRMKQIKKAKARGLHDATRDDPFELFISSTDIRWCYYKDTQKVLGNTFGMCVLQVTSMPRKAWFVHLRYQWLTCIFAVALLDRTSRR